jgi:hypothetical protein
MADEWRTGHYHHDMHIAESANPDRQNVSPVAVNFSKHYVVLGSNRDFFHSHKQHLHFLLLIYRRVYVLGAEDNETCFTFSFTALIRSLTSCVAPAIRN